MRGYSYLRVMRSLLLQAEGRGAGLDGLEGDVDKFLRARMPEDYKGHGGALVPMRTTKRTVLDTLTTGKGVETVQQQVGEFIELLRARARVLQAGAVQLTGLTGPVGFPKQTAGGTVYWVPENPGSDVSDADPTLGLALMSARTLQGNIPFTRQFLLQTSLDAEAWSRNELATGHGLAVDKGAIHGRGNNGEPTGIYAALGVNSKDFSSNVANLTTANLLSMVSAIADANADVSTMRWLTTPILAAVMRGTLELSAAGARTIWTGNLQDGDVLGYGASSTTQCSKVMSGSLPTGGSGHALVFGNWADMYIGLFGALELVVDPYSRKKRGIIEVTSFQMGDVLIRHGESFSKAVNLPAA